MQGGDAVSHTHAYKDHTPRPACVQMCEHHAFPSTLNSSLHPGGGDASQNGGGGKCNLSLNTNFMRLSLLC